MVDITLVTEFTNQLLRYIGLINWFMNRQNWSASPFPFQDIYGIFFGKFAAIPLCQFGGYKFFFNHRINSIFAHINIKYCSIPRYPYLSRVFVFSIFNHTRNLPASNLYAETSGVSKGCTRWCPSS